METIYNAWDDWLLFTGVRQELMIQYMTWGIVILIGSTIVTGAYLYRRFWYIR